MPHPQPETEEFTCAFCGRIFAKEWTHEEALAEYRENFGRAKRAEGVSVCDDCYTEFVLPELEKE
jgi:hypothetical protein